MLKTLRDRRSPLIYRFESRAPGRPSKWSSAAGLDTPLTTVPRDKVLHWSVCQSLDRPRRPSSEAHPSILPFHQEGIQGTHRGGQGSLCLFSQSLILR